YVVGGCVRDIMLKKEPNDWDITTDAKPEEIQKIFSDSFYENKFGTVGVKTGSSKTGSSKTGLEIVEVTTFRSEAKYSDKRHPDKVEFSSSVEEDLKRRDFTINAMAMDLNGNIVDIFNGQKDLEKRIIRAVGDPGDRFDEDALRMLRAIRFATQLDFNIENKTLKALKSNAESIKAIANERVRDELSKMIDTPNAHQGVLLLKETGLLELVLPEIAEGIGVEQNKHHIYTVFEHNLYSLQWAAEHDYPFHVKFAALFHDVGKPQTKRGGGEDATFYGHDVVGSKITKKALKRLKFPKKFIKNVALLVRYHLFYYDTDEVTESSIRRLVANVGPENMDDLVKVRICDRMGSGVPKPKPYRLRHFQYMVEKVQKDPISVKMLKVDGNDIMEELDIDGDPKIGQILHILLDEVLDDPKKNKKKYQLKRVRELGEYSDKELSELYKKALKKQEMVERGRDEEIKKKYHVK
ncbi:MAG: HD domain-containing protein, partial [Candidatus Spechtbacterales bacterium]|nr:HD domain-containing protein [Candidatus Spechtbacterales bacterium]